MARRSEKRRGEGRSTQFPRKRNKLRLGRRLLAPENFGEGGTRSTPLGLIHGRIGLDDQLFWSSRTARIDRDTDARPHHELIAPPRISAWKFSGRCCARCAPCSRDLGDLPIDRGVRRRHCDRRCLLHGHALTGDLRPPSGPRRQQCGRCLVAQPSHRHSRNQRRQTQRINPQVQSK